MNRQKSRSQAYCFKFISFTRSILVVCAATMLAGSIAQSARAENITKLANTVEVTSSPLKAPDILAQAAPLQITGVQVQQSTSGVETILTSPAGTIPLPVGQTSKNIIIYDLPNTVLALPNATEYRSDNPTSGILSIVVTQFTPSTARVTITGVESLPEVKVATGVNGLTLSVATLVAASSEPELSINVTGTLKNNRGYTLPNSTTATITDTPLRDIPQSIQVIPQQVLKDQGITRITDAVRNVSGAQIGAGYGNLFGDINLRGFFSEPLVDGFNGLLPANGANVEQVEVLKGPASVLYGQGEAGGLVNYVTKKPLSKPTYSASFTVGSNNYYNPAIDLSGPLTADKKLLYRFNASYENSGSYRDFVKNNILYIAPSFSYKISDATSLNFAYEYLNSKQTFDRGFKPEAIFLTLPVNRLLNQPDDFSNTEAHQFGLTINQQFNENWGLKSRVSAKFDRNAVKVTQTFGDLSADGTLTRGQFGEGPNFSQAYALQTRAIGKFNIGAVPNQLVLGLDWKKTSGQANNSYGTVDFPSINIFNPDYNVLLPDITVGRRNSGSTTTGIYVQNQATLSPNLKLLLGGRYDFVGSSSEDFGDTVSGSGTGKSQFDSGAFSPRVGIVYQPIEPISLYASYNRSFTPNLETRKADQTQIEPSFGSQYEVGVRAELLNKRLAVNLAAYDITKTNIPTTDLSNDQFSIAIGEVKSRGIELDVAGEISPGWKVIASGFLNDAYVSKDNDPIAQGKRLANAPTHGASLWTSYELQQGDLKGLQFGAGLFFKGDRITNQNEPLILPSYVTTDAAISYKRDDWQAALNFKNIFGVKYFESNGFLVFPQAPFTVQATVSVKF